MKRKIEVAAYYFPNYHYDEKNEKWHGEKWNEWHLVKAAKPRFEGHTLPNVPLWGYENEAEPKVMEKKIKAASDYGLSAFIFDWYWHEEGPFLEKCLEEGYLKASNNQDLKFAIMWANHDWLEIHPATRYQPYPVRRKGEISEEVFIKATNHIIDNYLTHPSYWRVDGKLYFSIYEMMSLIRGFGGIQNTKRILTEFRERVRAKGLGELHLNAVVWGIETLPTENTLSDPNEIIEFLGIDSATSYVWVHHIPFEQFPKTSYRRMRELCKDEHKRLQKLYPIPYIPNVTVGWDSSPRTIQTDEFDDIGYPYFPVYMDNTPAEFEQALLDMKGFLLSDIANTNVCTINAWNEWTEGSYLEPDERNGYGFLEAISRVFKES